MKTFLDIIKEEENGKHAVLAFGRMNPPTTGHLKVIDKVKELAKNKNATHKVVVSHSQDSKKNPLSGDQKVKHLNRYSPGTNFEASTKNEPTILHHAAKLHKQGHDHLTVVAGSDRVKEMHDLLHRYNNVPGRHGHYNFKSIEIKSSGERDPDSEGTEGMSGTKMRQHATNNDLKSFRKGVPSHVSDKHAKELMHDVRRGIGIHEDHRRGLYKAVFVTGCPGSGKDVVIRNSIAESKSVEMNSIQAYNYLSNKSKLNERSSDLRKESIRKRLPIIINCQADDIDSITYIKEELENIGYKTTMIFVNTTNESSRERNQKLTRMMSESVRHDKWKKSQHNKNTFTEQFENFIYFDNSGSFDDIEEDITETYVKINKFFDSPLYESDNFITEDDNVKIKKFNFRATSPSDIPPDNRMGDPNSDDIKYDYPKRTKTYTFRTYSEGVSVKVMPEPKVPNFEKDKEYGKKDRSSKPGSVRATGVGAEYDTRAPGTSASANAGLERTFVESTDFSNDDVINYAGQTRGPEPNPLDNRYTQQKSFKKFRKEAIDDPGANDMGVSGTMSGASNKEPLVTPLQKYGQSGITIKKNNKRR